MKNKRKIDLKNKILGDHLFAIAMVIIPIGWWAFSFLFTTTDTILLAFKSYDAYKNSTTMVGLDNFITVIKSLGSSGAILNISFRNSLILWLINVCFSIPLAVVVSFSLHKNVVGVGAYKVILFLPHIVSSMVWVMIYKYLITYGFKMGNVWFSIAHEKESYLTLLFYSLWLGFAGNMVLYTGAMSRIPPELTEAGHLDGMNDFNELIKIVIPMIFPTLSVILTTCVVGIFGSQLPSYAFYGQDISQRAEHLYTLGFYTFIKGKVGDPTQTPLVSALSIIVCLIAAPFTLGVRKLLEKIDPMAQY